MISPPANGTDEFTFFSNIVFDGLKADKSILDAIFIPGYHPNMTLWAQVFTYALNSTLFLDDFPTYLVVVMIKAYILEKEQITFAVLLQADLPELIAQSIKLVCIRSFFYNFY